MTNTLLQTKLYIPPTRPNIVPRTELLQKLNDGLLGKLTLASAPAGFGKTTLITNWLLQLDRPVGWVSLDEDDSNPQQFFRYVAAAIRPFPDNSHSLTNHLQSPQPAPAKALAAALVNDLVSVSTPCLLVLDDYHEIDSADIDLALAFILDHMPPNLHLIITSRADPGFPLSRLRARGQLTELRAQDLRFSVEETAVFLQNTMSITLTAEQITALEARTEGWVSGLQMAALSMKNRDDLDGFIDNFAGSHRFIMDYLTDEVLQQVPPAVQDFLLQTSILTRLSAPLCTAVIGKEFGVDVAQRHLDYLDHNNLFLIPLDDKRTWYRYHHLFADLLQKKQEKDGKERHRRASYWFEENGMINEALHHARAAKDFDRAAQLIVENKTGMFSQGNSDSLFSWINTMPDDVVRANSLLAIGKAWSLLYRQMFQECESFLVSAEAVLKTDVSATAQRQQIEIISMRAMIARVNGDYQQAIIMCRRALEQLSAEDWFARASLNFSLGVALHINGNTQEAISIHLKCIHASTEAGHFLYLMGSIYQLYRLYVDCGRLHEAVQLLQTTWEKYESFEYLPAQAQIHLGLGDVAYERNELDLAADQLRAAISVSQVDLITLWTQILLAQVEITKGDVFGSEKVLRQAEEKLQHWPVNWSAEYMRAYRACMAVWQGDLDQARSWQRKSNILLSSPLSYANEFQMLVLARLLIAEGRQASSTSYFSEALTLLANIEEMATAAGRFGRAMVAQLLQALTYDAQGETDKAIQRLEKALALAEVEGFFRTFVDEGEPMAVLLRRMEKRPYITKLLAAFPDLISDPPSQSPIPTPHSPLVEPLSDREIEILTLIAAGKKNKEIAAELFISYNTVLYHTKNLYGKLGVNKRTQAVLKAQELGLI